ncbi:rhombosortase [Aestuariibacter sp. GS-14]|nr:rhombosortase [Aestuariibacter sp. GS-14]TPV60063.1 rhombosortase [Aestuariibacter sp. GS-14]
MVALPLKPQFSLGPAILLVTVILLFFMGSSTTELLAYDRYALESLETWRLLSGNLVHTNGYHLLLNGAGLFFLWALHGEHYKPLLFIKLFLWCGLGTSLGIYFLSPSLIWYVGLSGALHGLFVWGACMDIRNKVYSGALLLLGIMAKVSWEQWQGSSKDVAELIGASVAIDAHLYGAASGFALFLLMWVMSVLYSVIKPRQAA